MTAPRRILPILFVFSCLSSPAFAAWPNSPFTNLPVCTASNSQLTPVIVSDGSGGAIVSWSDYRSGTNDDIYAQHVLASGMVDPAWPANGRALCTAANSQSAPTIASDGAGGAIITWADKRSGVGSDIYAQHVLASGVVDPAWPANGRAVCTAAGYQSFPTIVSDGAGGAIVTWYDNRSATDFDIYAQHVLASGAADPAWPADGVALCMVPGDQYFPVIISDGAAGAIVTWYDGRSGTSYDIYAQHVLASGAVDPAWPVGGSALCTAANDQFAPTIVSDGAGGAIVTWDENRSDTNLDIYAQHVLASGPVDLAWPADGRALCTAAHEQHDPTIVSDGAGGAIVTWYDYRSGTNYDIYAQHVQSTGAVDPAWPADGRALCTAANDQYFPKIVSDGAAGAIVTWFDFRGGTYFDVYAQHVLASGAVDPAWPADGRALCTASNSQMNPAIAQDGEGGAIITWEDFRSGTGNDIYAQRVARFGYLGTPEAEIVGVNDVPNDQGGKVKLSWNASYLDLERDVNLSTYDVLRSVPTILVTAARLRGANVRSLAGDGFALRPGDLVAQVAGTRTYYWEYLTTIPALHYVSGYSYLTSTAFDSVGGSNPGTAFLVVARNGDNTMYWPSRPDSGYSVDNLAPSAPSAFTGQYSALATHLHWQPNVESDLAGYRLYRGSSISFVPGPGNLVATPPDTGYSDMAGAPYIYKLSGVDIHGNESPVAPLVPTGTSGVGGPIIAELSLSRPAPNPTSHGTSMGWALPRAAHMRLAIYDAAGRVMRVLADGEFPAGTHAATWDLRDEAGRSVGAGLYFAKLEADGMACVRRIAVMR